MLPIAAYAQQNDNPAEAGTPDEQVAPGPVDQPGLSGACGPNGPLDRLPMAVAPTGEGDANKDVTGAQRLDLSQVEGTIFHVEGNLALIRLSPLQMTPAAGGSSRTEWAVARLPAACLPDFVTGSSVTVVGTPGVDGIIAVESIQSAT